jgi:hypothetical protein
MTDSRSSSTGLDLEIRIQVGPRPADKPQAGITVEAVDSF